MQKATFAGGCFWCMVKPFDQWDGIHRVTSGFMGGRVAHPTYEEVKRGDTGHLEVVQIEFDESLFSYEQLLDIYWQQIDPTDAGGQFHDRGEAYTTTIFVHTEAQRQAALASKRKLDESGRFDAPIVTPIRDAMPFYEAEAVHQRYYVTSAAHYERDRAQSGRDEFLRRVWSK